MNAAYKRVVFVIGSLRYSGAERVLICVANSLVSKGREVYILLLQPGGRDTYNDMLDSRIRCIEAAVSGNFLTRKIKRLIKIRAQLKLLKPDIVVSFGTICNTNTLAGMVLSETPVVVSERNDPKFDPPDLFYRMMRTLTYPFASGFIFQTEGARDFFSATIQNRSAVIPNPIAAETIPVAFCGERRKEIVSAGRLDVRQKNHHLLIKAFASIADEFPEYRLVIYGEGPDRMQLESSIADTGLGERILLPGSEPKVPQRICDASLFVLSSNFEGMPNALIEAMAVGLPVISTDCPCGGPKYLIKHGLTGMLTPVGNVQRLAACLRNMLLDAELAKAMGEKAREEILRELAPEMISTKWDNYLNSVTATQTK